MQKKINKWMLSGKIDKIKKVLKDENYKNRLEAVKALGEIGNTTAIEDIRNLINDPIKSVIETAADTLKKLGAESSIQKEFESRLIELNNREEKKTDRRKETWREKTEEEIREDLERRAKMIGIHQIEKEALSVKRKNQKQKAITGSIANIFGTRRK